MSPAVGYLLDTNIVLALMRANPLGRLISTTYGLGSGFNRSSVSIVTVGETLALARQFGWGKSKLDALESMLDQLTWLDIGHRQVIDAYAEIHEASRKAGRTMGENDLWIAATARTSGMTLLTTDKDFDHLDGTWIDRVWIDPKSSKTP